MVEFDPPIPPPPLPPPVSVAARFVSESTLEAAKEVRAEEWRAMHEKLGQPVPVMEENKEPYDGRSLWEKLQEHKDKKQDAFDEQLKFKNQFRALDEDEISFLDSLVDDNNEEEERRVAEANEQLAGFRQAVVARQALPPPPTISTAISSNAASSIASTSSLLPPALSSPSAASASTASLPQLGKKSKKKALAGVVIKRKSVSAGSGLVEAAAAIKRRVSETLVATSLAEGSGNAEQDREGDAKKQKI